MFSLRSVIYTALSDLKGVFKGDLKGVNFLLVALKGVPFRVHSFLVLSCNVNC